MAKTFIGNSADGFPIYTGSSADLTGYTDALRNTKFILENNGSEYFWDGAAWINTTTNGNFHVLLRAGTNNIGDVDVLTLPSIPAGTNNIGDVDVLTLPSIPAGTNNIGGITGTGIHVAASVDVNSAIAADVDAAVAAATGLRLVGFACRESAATAAAATFIIVHGATGAGGTAIIPVELAADGSRSEWFGPEGIAVANGISIDWIAGTVDVHLFYKTVA